MTESADEFKAQSHPPEDESPLANGSIDRIQSRSFARGTRAETILIWVLAFFGLWVFPRIALTSDSVDNESATRPNIVLMIADDMSWKDWGIYGNKFAKTPASMRNLHLHGIELGPLADGSVVANLNSED